MKIRFHNASIERRAIIESQMISHLLFFIVFRESFEVGARSHVVLSDFDRPLD